MSKSRPTYYVPDQTKCDVCASSLRFNEFLVLKDKTSLVCQSHECRQIAGKKNRFPDLYRKEVESRRLKLEVQRKQAAEKEARIARMDEREFSENQQVLKSVLKTLPDLQNPPCVTVSMPPGITLRNGPDKEKVAEYKSQLKALIEKVFAEMVVTDRVATEAKDPGEPGEVLEDQDLNPTLTAVRARLCGVCKSGCCPTAGPLAYLNKRTIRRVIKARPHHSPADIFHEYTSRLSDKALANSCVNHTSTGCVLPRDLRSDICNDFLCKPLLELENLVERGSSTPVLAIKRYYERARRHLDPGKSKITEVVMVWPDKSSTVQFKHPKPQGRSKES